MTMFDNNHLSSNYNYYYCCSDQNLCKNHYFVGLGQYNTRGLLMSQLDQQQPPRGFLHRRRHRFKSSNCLLDSGLDSDSNCLSGSDLMAEDESRTESVNEEGSSYSKDVTATATTTITTIVTVDNSNIFERVDDRKEWLRLGIGGAGAAPSSRDEEDRERGGSGLVELDLLPPGPSSGPVRAVEFRAPPPHFAIPQPNPIVTPGTAAAAFGYIGAAPAGYFLPAGSDLNWAIRPVMGFSGPGPSPSSSSPFMYSQPRFVNRPPPAFPLLYGGVAAGGAAPPLPHSFDFRVIDPPRRPHSGIWFSLQASQNQAKEPFLPQIPKSYLRIKDGNMTIRLVLKYLVNKLQLENESEIEITCRGQELPPSLTLQHVRDQIWMNNNNINNNINNQQFITLLPQPSTSTTTTNNHVMVLLYGRKSSSSA